MGKNFFERFVKQCSKREIEEIKAAIVNYDTEEDNRKLLLKKYKALKKMEKIPKTKLIQRFDADLVVASYFERGGHLRGIKPDVDFIEQDIPEEALEHVESQLTPPAEIVSTPRKPNDSYLNGPFMMNPDPGFPTVALRPEEPPESTEFLSSELLSNKRFQRRLAELRRGIYGEDPLSFIPARVIRSGKLSEESIGEGPADEHRIYLGSDLIGYFEVPHECVPLTQTMKDAMNKGEEE